MVRYVCLSFIASGHSDWGISCFRMVCTCMCKLPGQMFPGLSLPSVVTTIIKPEKRVSTNTTVMIRANPDQHNHQ